MRKTALILTIVLLLLAVTACGELPASGASTQQSGQLTGGDAALGDGINLKDISLEIQGQKTIIDLGFISGSRVAGADEAKISSVPSYSVSVLSDPTRVRVALDVDYMDYSSEIELLADSIIYGVFRSAQGKMPSVYFQLREDVDISVSESDAMLRLELTPTGQAAREAWYFGVDAFEAYEAGGIPDEAGLTPSLCEEGASVILISGPFSGEEGANEAAQEAAALLGQAGERPYVFSMQTNALPAGIPQDSPEELMEENAIMEVGSATSTLPVLIGNGKYQCMTPGGDVIFSRTYVPDAAQDNEYVLKEALWRQDAQGNTEEMELIDFYSIEQAAVSADGQYLAVLDSGISNRLLYVKDLQSGELHNLGEEGFGDSTASFVWDAAAPVIYAMTGANTLQLTQYDFSMPAGERVSSVEEKNGADSKIALADGKIYFADRAAGEDGVIYSVDIGEAARGEIGAGGGFALSPGGYYLAALREEQLDEYMVRYGLDLIDLQTDNMAPKRIIEDVETFAFGVDNDSLYFMTQDDEGIAGEYQYAFKKYTVSTGETTLLGYTKTAVFTPGDKVGEVYIIDYMIQDDEGFYVTYIYEES